MSKRYFWLKLKDDFFNQKEIKVLRKIAGGDTYTIIYLKLLLVSLKNEGKIFFDGMADNFAEEIALDIDEDIENVKVTLNFLQTKGLLEFIADDEVELVNVASMIGSETDKAAIMRRKRKREKEALGNNVTKELPDSYTEIEIDIEKELDIEKEIEKDSKPGKPDRIPYQVIVDYLNDKAGTNYRHTTRDTQDKIKARVKEGFEVNDFKKVIDNMVAEWANDQKMKVYLRPATLFGPKFDSYLNRPTNVMTFEFSGENTFKNEPVPEEEAKALLSRFSYGRKD